MPVRSGSTDSEPIGARAPKSWFRLVTDDTPAPSHCWLWSYRTGVPSELPYPWPLQLCPWVRPPGNLRIRWLVKVQIWPILPLHTLKGSPLRIFFTRNFSMLGGATRTTYGFKSDDRNSFRLCGCKFSTQILPLATTARMASKEVPVIITKCTRLTSNLK